MTDARARLQYRPEAFVRARLDEAEAEAHRIIADCEADLAILELHDDLHDCVTPTSSQVFPAGDRDEIPCPALQWLAYRYRHRPGYLPEWAPEGAAP